MAKPGDNLRPHSSGALEGETESNSQFVTKHGRRANNNNGNNKDNLGTNKDVKFDDGTINKYSYNNYADGSGGQGGKQPMVIKH